MGKIQVFLDTDVVISALLSKTGASYELIRNPLVSKIISKTVKKEIEEVTKRLNIDNQKVERVLKKINTTSSNLTKKEVSEEYKKFVLDEKNSHVVAGANKTKSKFLLARNLKHYRVDKINNEFGIIVLKPGIFLQYLRSLGKF